MSFDFPREDSAFPLNASNPELDFNENFKAAIHAVKGISFGELLSKNFV